MNKAVIITGATGGIGEALAFEFASHGHNLVLVGRNLEKLASLRERILALHQVDIYMISQDLATDDASDVIYQQFKQLNLEAEVLCNNAGYGIYGAFLESDLNQQMAMLQVNMNALVGLSYRFGKEMKSGSTIINVASIGSFVPGALFATYYASKAFVLSFSEALHEELKNRVNILALCPGPTNTNFFKTADANGNSLLNNLKAGSPTKVARKAYQGYLHKRCIVIPGFVNKLGVFATRLVPRGLIRRMVARMQRKRTK